MHVKYANTYSICFWKKGKQLNAYEKTLVEYNIELNGMVWVLNYAHNIVTAVDKNYAYHTTYFITHSRKFYTFVFPISKMLYSC